ncbi:unnamed protein product, partial [Prorocentrum cordatum]
VLSGQPIGAAAAIFSGLATCPGEKSKALPRGVTEWLPPTNTSPALELPARAEGGAPAPADGGAAE